MVTEQEKKLKNLNYFGSVKISAGLNISNFFKINSIFVALKFYIYKDQNVALFMAYSYETVFFLLI